MTVFRIATRSGFERCDRLDRPKITDLSSDYRYPFSVNFCRRPEEGLPDKKLLGPSPTYSLFYNTFYIAQYKILQGGWHCRCRMNSRTLHTDLNYYVFWVNNSSGWNDLTLAEMNQHFWTKSKFLGWNCTTFSDQIGPSAKKKRTEWLNTSYPHYVSRPHQFKILNRRSRHKFRLLYNTMVIQIDIRYR